MDGEKQKIIFINIDPNPYANNMRLEFECSEDMPLSEFHRLCKYAAAAMGFGERTIEEYFGESHFEDE